MPNKVAYFDISIGGEPAGRIEFELFDDVVPKVSSFRLSELTPDHGQL